MSVFLSDCTVHNRSCTLNVIYNIGAISHLLHEITRQRTGKKKEKNKRKSPTQHVKTCVRFRRRQGHPVSASPQRRGSTTGSPFQNANKQFVFFFCAGELLFVYNNRTGWCRGAFNLPAERNCATLQYSTHTHTQSKKHTQNKIQKVKKAKHTKKAR